MNGSSDIIQDTFKSIAAPSEGLFKDNGSRFIARAYPVETEEEIKEIVTSLKKEFHDARHHCYAWRLGHLGDRFRANDDGEPSGSSGRPILGQIESRGLSDILVVVIRYFGGIKLGTSGLINAYKTAAADALRQAEKEEKIVTRRFVAHFPYGQMNTAMRLAKEMQLQILKQEADTECHLLIAVRLSEASRCQKRFEEERIPLEEARP